MNASQWPKRIAELEAVLGDAIAKFEADHYVKISALEIQRIPVKYLSSANDTIAAVRVSAIAERP